MYELLFGRWLLRQVLLLSLALKPADQLNDGKVRTPGTDLGRQRIPGAFGLANRRMQAIQLRMEPVECATIHQDGFCAETPPIGCLAFRLSRITFWTSHFLYSIVFCHVTLRGTHGKLPSQAIAIPLDVDHRTMMQQAIQHRRHQHRVVKEFGPITEGFIRG